MSRWGCYMDLIGPLCWSERSEVRNRRVCSRISAWKAGLIRGAGKRPWNKYSKSESAPQDGLLHVVYGGRIMGEFVII